MKRVLGWFAPKEVKFFNMLKHQSVNLVEGSELFKDFMHNYKKMTPEQRGERMAKIKDIELKGDKIIHRIMEDLDSTFITPFDREDIHELASFTDDILDLINAVSKRLIVYKFKDINQPMKRFSSLIHSSAIEIDRANSNFRNLKIIATHCKRIKELEEETDSLYLESLTNLFSNTEQKNPLETMKQKEIYDILEKITDRCKQASMILESIVIKHA